MGTKKQLEELITIIYGLDNHEIAGLVFFLILLIIHFLVWRWVLFKNGAHEWMEQIMNYREMLGQKADPDSITFKPLIFKILVTMMLLFLLVAFILIIINIFQKVV